MTPPLIALCVGHSRQINDRPEGGADSVGGVSEWTYHRELATMIRETLSESRVAARIYADYGPGSYGSAQRLLATVLRRDRVTIAVELHFNSSDSPAATGHEWLYWHASSASKRLAESLSAEMSLSFPEIKTRGAKPKDAADRGAEFLRGTHCPAVIAEPFFGSNPADWKTATSRKYSLARAIACGILDYLD